MAFRGRGGASSFTTTGNRRVSGGQKHNRIIRLAGDPVVNARAGARALRKIVLPELRSRVPVDTGALKSSLRIRQRGTRVQLLGTDYAPFVRWNRGGRFTSVASEAHHIVFRRREAIRQEIRAALREVLQ